MKRKRKKAPEESRSESGTEARNNFVQCSKHVQSSQAPPLNAVSICLVLWLARSKPAYILR